MAKTKRGSKKWKRVTKKRSRKLPTKDDYKAIATLGNRNGSNSKEILRYLKRHGVRAKPFLIYLVLARGVKSGELTRTRQGFKLSKSGLTKKGKKKATRRRKPRKARKPTRKARKGRTRRSIKKKTKKGRKGKKAGRRRRVSGKARKGARRRRPIARKQRRKGTRRRTVKKTRRVRRRRR